MQKIESIDKYVNNIINGYNDAYKLFLVEFQKDDDEGKTYPAFVEKILAQKDFTACDYYAIYDICYYLINSILIKKDEKEKIVGELSKALLPAAEKGHLAALCVLIILESKFNQTKLSKNLLETAHRNALNLLLKGKNNTTATKSSKKNPQKQNGSHKHIGWSSFFLALYCEHRLKEDPKEIFSRYYLPYYKYNLAMIHYLELNNLEESFNIGLYVECLSKPPQLLSLSYTLSNKYCDWIGTGHKVFLKTQKISVVKNITENLMTYCSYDYPYSRFLLGLFAYIWDNPTVAFGCLNLAAKLGFQKAIELLPKIIKKYPDAKRNFDRLGESCEQETATAIHRNFLYQNGTSAVLKLHADLEQDQKEKNCTRISIENNLFNKMLDEISTNNNIESLEIIKVNYDLNLDKLLDCLMKNSNIKTVRIEQTKMTSSDYSKILNYILKNTHIEKFILDSIEIDYFLNEKESNDIAKITLIYEIFFRSFLKLLSETKHLKDLEIHGIFYRDNDIERIFKALDSNLNLRNTNITLRNLKINDKHLLLLSKILNSNISRLNLLNKTPSYSVEGLREFAKKLRGNNNLVHFGRERLIEFNCSDALIKANNNLFDILLTDTQVQSIDLAYYNPDAKSEDTNIAYISMDTKVLRDAIVKSKNLRMLNLANSKIKDNDLIKFAYIFESRNVVQALNLSKNNFTHRGLLTLAKILSENKNQLTLLDLSDPKSNKDKRDDLINVALFYDALKTIISSEYCALQTLSFPVFICDKDDDIKSYDRFLAELVQNSTIIQINPSGALTDAHLEKLIEVVNLNHNIKGSCFTCVDNINIDLITKLVDQLSSNQELNENNPLPLSNSPSVYARKSIAMEPKKASKQTFETLFFGLDLKYELRLIENDCTLEIELPSSSYANVVARLLNSAKPLVKVVDQFIRIPDFTTINEFEILSLSLELKSDLDRLKININTVPQVTVLAYLQKAKHISYEIQDDHLLLCLSNSLKVTDELRASILQMIATSLSAREIVVIVTKNQITIENYKQMSTAKLSGIANEISGLIKENYTQYKQSKQSFNAIQEKLLEENDLDTNIDQYKNDTLESIRTNNDEEDFLAESEADLVVAVADPAEGKLEEFKIECIPYSNILTPLPTVERFYRLITKLNQKEESSFEADPNMRLIRMIVEHHTQILDITDSENIKKVYAVLYHSIRISELSLNYINQEKVQNPVLINTSYGMRSILADRPDYFLQDNINIAMTELQDHPKSFLTINRQILLDIFNDNSVYFKVKSLMGYLNVPCYNNFYVLDTHPKEIKLPIPEHFVSDPIASLKKMQSIISFIDENFTNPIDLYDGLSALKGAIFLLGHFARILRDHHEKYCEEYLEGKISKDCHSIPFGIELNSLLNSKNLVVDNSFQLFSFLGSLNEVDMMKLANNSNLLDYCLLLIHARNKMAHDEQPNSKKVDPLLDEIPTNSLINFALFFVKNKQLDCQLKILIEKGCGNSKTLAN